MTARAAAAWCALGYGAWCLWNAGQVVRNARGEFRAPPGMDRLDELKANLAAARWNVLIRAGLLGQSKFD